MAARKMRPRAGNTVKEPMVSAASRSDKPKPTIGEMKERVGSGRNSRSSLRDVFQRFLDLNLSPGMYIQVAGAVLATVVGSAIFYILGLKDSPEFTPEPMPMPSRRSQLPPQALGKLMTFIVVDAESERLDKRTGLTIMAGSIAIQDSHPVVTRIEATDRSAPLILFAAGPVAMTGGFSSHENKSVNCGIRAEVLTTLELVARNQFLLGLETWSIESGQEPCPYTF